MKNDTKIRRGQALHVFGIGSLISTQDDESMLILNNDLWKYAREGAYEVREDRLRSYLRVEGLRLPPEDKSEMNFRRFIPSTDYLTTIRLPGWHYCKFCKEMVHVKPTQQLPACNNNECRGFNSYYNNLIPVRFLTVCSNGHIDDFPFIEWVHSGRNEFTHTLEYRISKWTSTTKGINIACKTCEEKKDLGNALLPDRLNDIRSCNGYRHWLFNGDLEATREECVSTNDNYRYQGIQKGSSNLYFPISKSSIWIPEDHGFPQTILEFVEKWDLMEHRENMPEDNYSTLLGALYNRLERDFTIDDVNRYMVYRDQQPAVIEVDYEDLKYAEYTTFRLKPGLENDKDYSARILDVDNYNEAIHPYFESITMLEKLRETRAFCGFSRLSPFNDGSDIDLRDKIKETAGDSGILPANIVRGEGIFVSFSKRYIDRWNGNTNLNQHIGQISAEGGIGSVDSMESLSNFVLIHTFAHLLIKEISLECGYSNASIRERVYSNSIARAKMFGILIYTSEGDSEGSLGGLVRLGEPGRFETLIKNLLQKAEWCSGDPVCSSVGPQGPEGKNIAACHNCCILPETCCEYFNRFLDRNLLINTFGNKQVSYFK